MNRQHLLELLPLVRERFGVRLHAYVFMTSHYHLVLQTPGARRYQSTCEAALGQAALDEPWSEIIGSLVLGSREFVQSHKETLQRTTDDPSAVEICYACYGSVTLIVTDKMLISSNVYGLCYACYGSRHAWDVTGSEQVERRYAPSHPTHRPANNPLRWGAGAGGKPQKSQIKKR